MKKTCEYIGGQAIVEGVMMKSKARTALCVRNEDGELMFTVSKNKTKKNKIASLPFVRGFVNFCVMLKEGIGYIEKSADMAMSETERDDNNKDTDQTSNSTNGKKSKAKKDGLLATIIGIVLGLVLSIGLFIFLPTYLASFFREYINSHILINLLEGLIRIIIFVVYLLVITSFKDMRRYFMYHGAEHKTITCYESGEELTVENVKKCSRFHPRCGTTFMFLLMIISILIYSIIIWSENVLIRTVFRILLLPLIAGVSYEVLKFTAKYDNIVVNIIKAPGLLLQRLTTKEPDKEMIQTAIVSFCGALFDKEEMKIWKESDTGIDYEMYEA